MTVGLVGLAVAFVVVDVDVDVVVVVIGCNLMMSLKWWLLMVVLHTDF